MMACQEVKETCLGKVKGNPEKMKAGQEETEAASDTIRAPEDRYLVLRHC
jgi:hypothetical protein